MCGRRLSLKTVLMVGVQMLRRTADLHRAGFLHRDIKPGTLYTRATRAHDAQDTNVLARAEQLAIT